MSSYKIVNNNKSDTETTYTKTDTKKTNIKINISKNKKTHTDVDNYIENIYNFKDVWADKCSKYNIKHQPSVLPAVDRIIVIGDIHGDFEMCIKSLKVAKLIDGNNDWIGRDTIVVQVGDQIDRCRYSGIPCNKAEATDNDEDSDLKILQYFTKLHNQAQQYGGAVYSLIGNHELMNVNGDFRYVSYKGLVDFNYENNIGEQARRDAFSPGNSISEFLACTRQMALIIGSNLFVHAGILPSIAEKYSVKNLNELLSLYLFDELKDLSEYDDILNSSSFSPLWNRSFGNISRQKYNKELEYLDLSGTEYTESKSNCDKLLKPLKEIYKVDKIIVGHTPLIDNGIGNVCDKKIWLTDYGVSKAFDKFDSQSQINSNSSLNQHNDSKPFIRSSHRHAQVLEILNDGQQINILK